MNRKNLVSLLIAFAALSLGSMIAPRLASAFDCQSTGSGGTWNVAGSWVGATCNSTWPQATDTAEVMAGATVTLDSARSIVGVQVDGTGVLANGGFLLTVTGTGSGINGFTINGTLSGTGGATLSGAGATVDGTGTPSFTGLLTFTGDKTIAASANLSFAGALTVSTGSAITITAGANITVAGTATVTSTGAVTNNGTFTASGTFTGTGGWTQAAGSVLYLRGATTNANAITTFTATANNTVYYDLNGAQTCKVVTYYTLILGGGNTKTCAVTTVTNLTVQSGAATTTWNVSTGVAIAGNLNISGTSGSLLATAAWQTNGGTLTVSGNLVMGYATVTRAAGTTNITVSTGTFTVTSGTTVDVQRGVFTIGGASTIDGTFTFSTSTTGAATFTGKVTVGSAGSFNISVAKAITWNNIENNNTTAATFNTGTGTQTIGGTATISGSGPMTIGAAVSVPTATTLTVTNTNTVTFSSTLTLPVGSPTLIINNTATGSVTTTSLTYTANTTVSGAQLTTLAANGHLSPTAIAMGAPGASGATAKINSTGDGSALAVTNATTVTGSSTAGGGLNSIDFSGYNTTFSTGTLSLVGGSVGDDKVIMGSGALSTTTTLSITNGAAGTTTSAIDSSSSSGTVTSGTTTTVSTVGTAGSFSKIIMGSGQFQSGGLATVTGPASGTSVASITSNNGGKLDFNAALTFSGTVVANAQLITTVAATIELTGAMTGAGTLTFAASTIFQTSGVASFATAFTLPANATFNILNGSVMSLNNVIITIAGPTNISGTLQNATGASQKNFTGLVTLQSGGTFDMSVGTDAAVSFANGIAIDQGATSFSAPGTITFITNNQSITNGAGTPALANLSFGATTITTNTIILTNSYTGGTVTFATLSLVSPTAAYGLELATGTATISTGLISFAANATAGSFTEDITLTGTATLTAGSVTISAPTTTQAGAKTGIIANTGASGLVSIGATTLTCTGVGTQFCGIDLSAGTNALTVTTLGASGSATDTASVLMSSGTFTSSGLITLTPGSLNPSAIITRTTGTMNIGAGFTFAGAGNIANGQLNTGASTINLTGTMQGAGTLSIASATFRTTGGATIGAAYTLPNLNTLDSTTTLGAFAIVISGVTNVSGTLTNATGAQLKTFTGLVTVQNAGSFNLNVATLPAATFAGGIAIDQGATAFNATGTITFGTNSQSITNGSGTPALTPLTFGATSPAVGTVLTNSYTGGTVTFASLTLPNPTSADGITFATGSVTTVTGAFALSANTNTLNQTVTLEGTSSVTAGSLTVGTPTNTGNSTINCTGTTASLTSSAALTLTGNSTNTGAVSVTMGTCSLSTAGLTINGGSNGTGGITTVSASTGSITTTSGVTFGGTTANTRFTVSGAGTVNLTGTFGANGIVSINSGSTLHAIGTSAINGAYTWGNITQDSGSALTAGANITLVGNWTNNGGTFTPGAYTVLFSNGNAQNINGTSASETFNAVEINKSGNGVTVGGSIATVNIGGGITLTAGGLSAGSAVINVTAGDWTNNGGTFTPGSGTVNFTNTSANQNITGIAATQTFNSIGVNKTGRILAGFGSTTTLSIGGTLTLTAGTFSAGTATTINATGDWTNNGGSFTSTGSTVTFNSTSATQNINGSAATQTFNNLTVNNTGQILQAAGSATTLTINGNLLISAGNLTAGTATTINVAGNWTNSVGAAGFTAGSGTVVSTPSGSSSTLTGTTTFNSFSSTTAGKSLLFGAGDTFRFNGTLTLTGVSTPTYVSLNSNSSPTRWLINMQGTPAITYTSITNAGCNGSNTIDVSTGGNFDGGNNDSACWSFAATPTPTPTPPPAANTFNFGGTGSDTFTLQGINLN